MSLQCQGSALKLIYARDKNNELEKAKEEMRNLLKFKVIPVESGFDEVVEEEPWLKLQADIESNGKLCVLQNVSLKVLL